MLSCCKFHLSFFFVCAKDFLLIIQYTRGWKWQRISRDPWTIHVWEQDTSLFQSHGFKWILEHFGHFSSFPVYYLELIVVGVFSLSVRNRILHSCHLRVTELSWSIRLKLSAFKSKHFSVTLQHSHCRYIDVRMLCELMSSFGCLSNQ